MIKQILTELVKNNYPKGAGKIYQLRSIISFLILSLLIIFLAFCFGISPVAALLLIAVFLYLKTQEHLNAWKTYRILHVSLLFGVFFCIKSRSAVLKIIRTAETKALWKRILGLTNRVSLKNGFYI